MLDGYILGQLLIGLLIIVVLLAAAGSLIFYQAGRFASKATRAPLQWQRFFQQGQADGAREDQDADEWPPPRQSPSRPDASAQSQPKD